MCEVGIRRWGVLWWCAGYLLEARVRAGYCEVERAVRLRGTRYCASSCQLGFLALCVGNQSAE
jgi:hypothetical protein